MNSLLRILPWLACLTVGMASAQTQPSAEPESAWRINGFGTFGVTDTHAPDGWYFRRDAAQYPVSRSVAFDTDSRLGLQAHYNVSAQLELASQLVFKRRLTGSKPLESLEWLFASYKPTGDVTLRVGRTSPDIFLLSDYRNVGVAYPWVRPNVDLYAALPLYTIDGADASYVWGAGDARWRVKGFFGSANARASLATSPDQVNFKLRSAGGALITREQDGLLLRATLAGARMTASGSPQVVQAVAALDAVQSLGDPILAAQARSLEVNWGVMTDTAVFAELGLSYDQDDWLISAEYGQVRVPTGTRSSKSGYVSLGRRFGDYTFFSMLGRTVSTLGVQSTPDWSALGSQAQAVASAVAYGINGSRARQSSLSIGARWDFHPQAALKVQWDHFWVSSVGAGLWVGPTYQAAQPHVLSATLDFTF
ncbi:MAG TPA: hypothetical protein VFM48_01535 [Aquabacterium sp.]|nr:hypothetical protein [Aquabacterium sp.]